MITTNTIQARAALGATIAAICFAVAACGSEQGTLPDRNSKHAIQPATADDVGRRSSNASPRTQDWAVHSTPPQTTWRRWIEQRKSGHFTR